MVKPMVKPTILTFFKPWLDGNSSNCQGADALDQTFAAQDLEDSSIDSLSLNIR
jgi:hypothetical protein